MSNRDHAPKGAPTWVDLWTSDVDASRRFYAELLNWEAAEPSEEFGGYFMFLRDGVPVAGGMGPMGDATPDNRWKPYLQVADHAATIEAVTAAGGTVAVPAMAVADLGTQAVIVDPGGSAVGLWEPGTFPGFTVLEEPGAPSWFKLHTPAYAEVLSFFETCFGWEADTVADEEGFKYTIVRDADREGHVAGVSGTSDPAFASGWYVYWEVDDVDKALSVATGLGGRVVRPAEDTPYGRLAWLSDTTGAPFNLRRSPR